MDVVGRDELADGSIHVQLSGWVCVFDGSCDSRHHLFEFRTASCSKSLSMRLLQEPELLKGNDSVTAGDFEVELVAVRMDEIVWNVE